jgi:hypothetical protein
LVGRGFHPFLCERAACAGVITRIEGAVPALTGRTQGAAEFAALMKSNGLPQQIPAAHVLPLGLQGGAAQAATGMFAQALEEVIAVVLTWRGGDHV